MSISGLPFDDVRALLAQLPAGDENALHQTVTQNEVIEEKFGALGEQLGWLEFLSKWSGKSPNVSRPLLALFAGTHGIAEAMASANVEDTLATVTRLAAGGAPANQACAIADVGLKVFDLALQYPVESITISDALDEKASAATIGFGMEAIAGNVDLLGLSGFGQASEIANAAILNILLGIKAETSLDRFSIPYQPATIDLVEAVIAKHKDASGKPLELLRRVGGREHSALAGAILAARTSHIPVLLSGPTALCVALLLDTAEQGACDHCMIVGRTLTSDELNGALSNVPKMVCESGAPNDGSNIAMAIGMLKSACAVHNNCVVEVQDIAK